MGLRLIMLVIILVVSLFCGGSCLAERAAGSPNYFHGYTDHREHLHQFQRKKEPQPRELSHPLEWITTSPNISDACRTGWQYLWTHNQSLLKAKPSLGKTNLAERALDAFGRPVGGALQGGLSSYGSYDECLSTDHVQYCIIPLVSSTLPLPILSTIGAFGVCIPRECTEQDAALTAQIYLYPLHAQGYTLGGPQVSFGSKCQSERHPPFNAGAIVMIVLCCLLLAAALVGTSIHWVRDKLRSAEGMEDEDKNKTSAQLLDLVTSFSLCRNIPILLATKASSTSIKCLNGIRVISLLWVVLFHSSWWPPVNNSLYYNHVVKERTSYKAVRQEFHTSLAVSSFFLLSGLLVTYQRMRDMDKKNGNFPAIRYYVHRYLRITPTYMFVLFLYWFLTMHLSDGPVHQLYSGVDSYDYEMCERHWWRNVIYINNFSGIEACMPWSWYLACDLQFYYISPLLIVLLYYSLPLGVSATGIFLVGSMAASGAIAGYYEESNSLYNIYIYHREIYRTPYCHIAPWLVGIILGYMFFKNIRVPTTTIRNLTIPPWVYHLVLKGLAGILLLSVILLIPEFDSMIVTAVLHELMWGIGLGLIVYSCHTDNGGLVNSFLSMDIWLPFSRLTFSAYLIHPVIIRIMQGDFRDPIRYTDMRFGAYVVAAAVLAYAAAAVIAVFVEFPFANLDQLLFNEAERKMVACTRWCQSAVAKNDKAEELPEFASAEDSTDTETEKSNY